MKNIHTLLPELNEQQIKMLEQVIKEDVIGLDEKSDTERQAGHKDGKRLYVPAYSLRATVINQKLATQRARLARLLGRQE